MVRTYHDFYEQIKGTEYFAICKHHKLTRQEVNSSVTSLIVAEKPNKGVSYGILLLRARAYNDILVKYIYRTQRGLRQ